MEPDPLLLEPSDDALGSGDHHSKSGVDTPPIEAASVDAVALAQAAPVARPRGRTKDESAMALPSFIWDYFVKDASGKFVICTLCPAQTTRFAYSGGTSTMNRHLRKKHQKYAPGKSPADYEYPKTVPRRHVHAQPHAPASSLLASETPGLLSPNEALGGKQLHQLLELRTARRRAASGTGAAAKRRKLALEPTDPQPALGTEFDPSGFVTLAGTSSTITSSALQFPAGFELHDAGMDSMASMGFDQRFFDHSMLTGACTTTGSTGFSRGRRHGGSMGGSTTANGGTSLPSANTVATQKVLTHRLLRYLIAQYEPLDVSHMGADLGMLLFGGSTEWPTPALNFGYGGAFGCGSSLLGGSGLKLPSEETIKLALANMYYSQREILKEVIADVEVLSLSLNNWTSAFGQNVLTVSGHWISRGFRRRDCVLEVYVLPLDERVNTIALLRDVMDKWDIPSSKVAALTMRSQTPTTDSTNDEHTNTPRAFADARSEANAIHSEYPGLAVVRCFVEELEAAISSGLRKCVDLTRRCRTYVSYFIQNPSEYQIFLALQRSVGEEASIGSLASTQAASIGATADGVSVSIGESGNPTMGDDHVKEQPLDVAHDVSSSTETTGGTTSPNRVSSECSGEPLPVICDFDDRWNSTTEMMCRIVQLEPMLLRYKMGLESDTNPARRPMQLRFVCCELSTEEWARLKQLARLLERIEGVVHVSPLAYPGLSIVYPLLHSLKKHLDDAATWVTDPLVATVRHTIVTHLNINLCLSGQAPSSPYLSCLLDPRFKTLPFLSTEEKRRLVDSLYLLLGIHDNNDGMDEKQHQLDSGAEKTQRDEHKRQERRVKASIGSASGHGVASRKTSALLHEFFPLEEPANELEKLKAQVQQYLDSPSLPATDESEHDPLEWWSRYQRLFPALARLAKRYLCISAVSTPFQEAFTNYGELMREKKARLDIEVAAQVLFCRSVSRIPEIERIGV
ncbi:hypothetical protein PsorP6_017310 [Peronosclerospora sorghi]|uniref:Uncharacterized protein n=1 Tax=Peronosclerospora sorghi TaxID=230839 RepID=A0ACC0WN99_9STRA|nr:hypothetical protein PsorP6_017310 [Peronosclerospora sorghi]